MSNMAIAARLRNGVGGEQLAFTVNDVATIIERFARLDRDKLYQTIAGKRAKAQARQARYPTLLA
jgi:hypothetical protein